MKGVSLAVTGDCGSVTLATADQQAVKGESIVGSEQSSLSAPNYEDHPTGSKIPVELQPKLLPEIISHLPIQSINNTRIMNPINIPGLLYLPEFVTKREQQEILKLIYSKEWSTVLHRRQQFYGKVYFHTTHDLQQIQPVLNKNCNDINEFKFIIDRFMDMNLFSTFPDQILVNEYVGQMGIASHHDTEIAFGDTIVTLSLVNSCWLVLKHEQETKLLMEPRSLLVMKQDCRYLYKHGITKSKWVPINETMGVERTKDWCRVSLTFRHLLPTRKKVTKDTHGWIE